MSQHPLDQVRQFFPPIPTRRQEHSTATYEVENRIE